MINPVAEGVEPAPTGLLDHIALCCKSLIYHQKLHAAGVAYTTALVPELDMAQISFHDHAGVRIELNFIGKNFNSAT